MIMILSGINCVDSCKGLRENESARVRKRGHGSNSRGGDGDAAGSGAVAGDKTRCKSTTAESIGAQMLEKSLLTCSEVCWDNTDQWRRYTVATNMVTIRKKRLQLEIFEISFKGPLLGSSHPDVLDKIKVGRISVDRNQNGLLITDA